MRVVNKMHFQDTVQLPRTHQIPYLQRKPLRQLDCGADSVINPWRSRSYLHICTHLGAYLGDIRHGLPLAQFEQDFERAGSHSSRVTGIRWL